MTAPNDDAQREMEQRALRNVRGLVDKIETDDKLAQRSQVRMLIGIVLGAVVIAVLLGIGLSTRERGRSIVVEPPKPGQVMPQAPRAPQ